MGWAGVCLLRGRRSLSAKKGFSVSSRPPLKKLGRDTQASHHTSQSLLIFALTSSPPAFDTSTHQWTDPANRWTDPILPLTARGSCSPDPWPHPTPCSHLPTSIMGSNLLNISLHLAFPVFLLSNLARSHKNDLLIFDLALSSQSVVVRACTSVALSCSELHWSWFCIFVYSRHILFLGVRFPAFHSKSTD